MSYIMETLDAIEPLARHSVSRIGSLISFLLTSLVGRALGMVCKGIQSSLHGAKQYNDDKDNNRDQVYV